MTELDLLAKRLIRSHLQRDDLHEEGEVPDRVGRYSVVRPLARTPHGRSVLADDPQLGRQVVVRLLDGLDHERAARFAQTMRTLAALDHPHLARVYDAGIAPGGPYYVVEHAGELTLADAQLPLREAILALEQVAEGLHAAHQQQALHLALDPARIVVGGRTLLTDMGLAEALGTLESMPYRAPEQISRARPTRAADVYGLGAVLYEVLTGQPPYEAAERVELPRSPASLVDGLPPELCRLALESLDPDPRARPPSAKAFAERLRLWRERPTAPPPITARLLRRESAAEAPQPSWALVLVVAGLAIALGLALGAVTRSQVDAPSPTPPPAARGGR